MIIGCPLSTLTTPASGRSVENGNGTCVRCDMEKPELFKGLRMSMNKDDIHPPRTGRAFFSRILPGIRRLAALTRSPVPSAWERRAEGRVNGKSRNRRRWMLDVVGRWLLVVGAWMLGVGRLNCSRPARPARFAPAGHCARPSSRLHKNRPHAKIMGASRF